MMRYDRIAMQLLLVVCIAALGGCRYGDVGVVETACLDGGKDMHSSRRGFAAQLDCFVDEVRGMFDGNGSDPAIMEYESRFKMAYTDGRTFFSYRAECFRDNGRWLHGGSLVKVGTVDVKTGKRLTTADVIPPEKRDEAIARVREAVIAKIGGEDNLMPSAEEVLSKLSENFYVGKNSLHFVFNEYEVACYAQGVVEVVIPAFEMLR